MIWVLCLLSLENLDLEFLNEDETEQVLTAFAESIGALMQKQESRPSVVNPKRIREMLIVYEVLKKITKGRDIEVTYRVHEPFSSVGVISIVGKEISFSNIDAFDKIKTVVSNFEIYPRVSGVIQMNFDFHGLTIPLGR